MLKDSFIRLTLLIIITAHVTQDIQAQNNRRKNIIGISACIAALTFGYIAIKKYNSHCIKKQLTNLEEETVSAQAKYLRELDCLKLTDIATSETCCELVLSELLKNISPDQSESLALDHYKIQLKCIFKKLIKNRKDLEKNCAHWKNNLIHKDLYAQACKLKKSFDLLINGLDKLSKLLNAHENFFKLSCFYADHSDTYSSKLEIHLTPISTWLANDLHPTISTKFATTDQPYPYILYAKKLAHNLEILNKLLSAYAYNNQMQAYIYAQELQRNLNHIYKAIVNSPSYSEEQLAENKRLHKERDVKLLEESAHCATRTSEVAENRLQVSTRQPRETENKNQLNNQKVSLIATLNNNIVIFNCNIEILLRQRLFPDDTLSSQQVKSLLANIKLELDSIKQKIVN